MRFTPVIILVLVVIANAAIVYKEEICNSFPILYSGDALWILAHVKAFGEGEFIPFLPKVISRLNAPYEAWWSDFPITDLVYVIPGMVAATGVDWVSATTWTVIGLHALAGLAFYFSCKWLGGNSWVACSLGILFGLAPYGFVRGLEHLTLMHYWVIPLVLASVIRLWENRPLSKPERWLLVCIFFVTGLLNPYYFAISLVLLGYVGAGYCWCKDWRGVRWAFILAGVGVVGFLLQNLDTFLLRWREGANPLAVSRDLWWMVKFGLYLPDMFLPQSHLSRIMEHIGGLGYQWKIPEVLRGEGQRSYIGMVAGMALIWLMGLGFLSGATSKSQVDAEKANSPVEWKVFFWLALVVFVFSVAGGVNYLLGALGFPILRGSNRFSIVLACLALMFLARFLTSWRISSRWKGATCLALVAVGLPDQWPKWPDWVQRSREQGRLDFAEDQKFFPDLEKKLPAGAMIFQLPVMPYPENGPVHQMGDYEHFRPYLHTKTLRWSYGTVKGRPHADWQYALDFSRNPKQGIEELRLRDFSAILINRRAYGDGGEGLGKILQDSGCHFLGESDSYLVFQL